MIQNRYTPLSDQINLSLESQGEHILRFGNLEQIVTWVKQHPQESVTSYARGISTNQLIPNKSKLLIKDIITTLLPLSVWSDQIQPS